MKDLVSIITPSYNSALFIEDCVNSVLSQTYTNWEMIIVDDCSKDDSQDFIQSLSASDERFKAILLKKNIGAAAARNKALELASGRYVAFLDSDDVWFSDKLEKQIDFMQTNNYSFSFTSYQPMSEDGIKKHSVIQAPKKMTYNSYLRNTIIGCLTVVVDKDKFGEFRMPNIRSSHDMALWLQLMKINGGESAYGLDENLAYYRIVSSSNTSKKWKAASEVWSVYRNVEGLSLLRSAYCFFWYAFNAVIKRI